MKKNAALALVLFALIGVAWLLERDPDGEVLPLALKGEPLASFDPKDVVEIHLPNVKLKNENGTMVVVDLGHPADERAAGELVKKLRSLRSLKTLKTAEDKRDDFFSFQDHFIFVKTFHEEFRFRLGDVAELTGNFYIQSFKNGKESLHLAHDVSFFEGLYKNELEANLRKYLILKNLVAGKPYDYADRRVFGQDREPPKKIIVDNKRNRWFELDLANNQTNPAPPPGIRTNFQTSSLQERLGSMKFSEFFELKENDALNNLLSSAELHWEGHEETVELYGEFNGKKGLYLKRAGKVFNLETSAKILFLESVQSFWNKAPDLSGADLSRMSALKFQLGADPNKMRAFKVENLETFEVLSVESSVAVKDQKAFNFLFNALLSNNGFEQAQSAASLGPREILARVKGLPRKIYLQAFGKNWVFAFEDQNLVLLDQDSGVELVFANAAALESLEENQFFAFK